MESYRSVYSMPILIGFSFPSIHPFTWIFSHPPTREPIDPSSLFIGLPASLSFPPHYTGWGFSWPVAQFCILPELASVQAPCCPSVPSQTEHEGYQLPLLLARFLSFSNVVQHTMRKSRTDLRKQRDPKVTFRSRCCWYAVRANSNNSNAAELAVHGSFSLEGK